MPKRPLFSIRPKSTVIIHHPKKGILVVQSKGSNDWSLPGGGTKRNESHVRAAKRELREETGLKARKVRLLFTYLGIPKVKNGEVIRSHHRVYHAPNQHVSGTPRADHEIVAVRWHHPSNQPPLVLSHSARNIIDQYHEERRIIHEQEIKNQKAASKKQKQKNQPKKSNQKTNQKKKH